MMRRLWRRFLRPAIRALARVRLRSARRTASPAAARLLSVVQGTLEGLPGGEGRAQIGRIEALRASLAGSTRPLLLTDFGAGSPDAVRSEDEMRRGVKVETTVGAVCAASKGPFWGRLLFNLVAEYRPERCVELGTCLGLSAAYQGAALMVTGRGVLRTLEGAAPLVELSRRHLEGLGLGNVTVVEGRFEDTLDEVLRTGRPIDYAFVDGHHDERATVEYFRRLMSAASPQAVLAFDDISWSHGMRRAWEAITADERVRVSVDLRAVGLCLAGDASIPRERFTIRTA